MPLTWPRCPTPIAPDRPVVYLGAERRVLLSHANVLANIRAIGEAVAITPEDVAVSWLPFAMIWG